MGLGRGGGRGGALVPPVYMLKETLKYGSKFFIVCEDRGEDDQPFHQFWDLSVLEPNQ